MRVVPTYAIVVLIAFAAVLLTKSVAGFQPVVQDHVVHAESAIPSPSNACRFPTRLAPSPEQTAWQVFVAATCPVDETHAPYVVWEGWSEQHANLTPAARLVEASTKRALSAPKPVNPTGASRPFAGCRSSASGRTICEEVRVNPGMGWWLAETNRTSAPAITRAYASPDLLLPFVVVRAHWLRLASCAGAPQGVHVERAGSTCYELSAIQLLAELCNQWLSARFEVQDIGSNPMRCRTDGCRDPWGSAPSFSWGGAGGDTRISSELSSLMQDADLGSEWRNYRLSNADLGAIDNQGNPLSPAKSKDEAHLSLEDEKHERRRTSGESEIFALMADSSIQGPIALPEDRWSFRDSSTIADTNCTGNDFDQNCTDGPVTRSPSGDPPSRVIHRH